MVMVEPVSSSRFALLLRAASLDAPAFPAELPQAERLRVVDHRHLQTVRGLGGQTQVHRAVAHEHAAFGIVVCVGMGNPASTRMSASARNGR